MEDMKLKNILKCRSFSLWRRSWRMRPLIAFLLLPLLAFAQPGNDYKSCQIGSSYKDFQHSEFAQFFHAKETKKAAYENGYMREIKIGGFQELITVYVYTDTNWTIHEATLVLDSEWVHEEKYNPLARDLIQSFLIDFICPNDVAKVRPAAQLIFRKTPTKDKFATGVNDVFNGKQTKYSEKLGKCTVSFENFSSGDFSYLRVKISD
jgi:hypothetical protein